MGRKIPGRKHRGIRDFDKQRQERFDKIKDKIDAPPIDKHDQEIPKSLARLIELKQKVKSGEYLKKPKTSKPKKKNAPVHFKPSQAGLEGGAGPIYVQGNGESDRSFMFRVNKVVHDVLRESAFSEKYKVNIKRNQETGEVETVEKRERDPLEMFTEQLKRDKKDSKGKKKMKKRKPEEEKEKLSKSQKKLRKQKIKRECKCKNAIEDLIEVRHEHVKFGEVAHAPPTLVKPRKVEKTICAPRPGSKDLLLKSVFKSGGDRNSLSSDSPPKKKKIDIQKKQIDKKGKRKNLPVALRRQLEKQQSEIVQAYKEMKKQRYMNSNC